MSSLVGKTIPAIPVLGWELFGSSEGPKILPAGETPPSSKLLLEHPHSTYSGARTIGGGKRIFALDHHFERLAQLEPAQDWFRSKEERSSHFLPLTKLALAEFHTRNPSFFQSFSTVSDPPTPPPSSTPSSTPSSSSPSSGQNREVKLVFLLTGESKFFVHISELPVYSRTTKIEFCIGHRDNATVKSTDWVKSRVQWEQQAANDGAEEVVLCDQDGNISEGLQSNFYIIDQHGKLITASADAVLTGTMQRVLLNQVLPESFPDLPVERRCPTLDEVRSCQGAFLSSSSRFILPISHVVIPSSTPAEPLLLPDSPLVFALREKLIERVHSDSTPILS